MWRNATPQLKQTYAIPTKRHSKNRGLWHINFAQRPVRSLPIKYPVWSIFTGRTKLTFTVIIVLSTKGDVGRTAGSATVPMFYTYKIIKSIPIKSAEWQHNNSRRIISVKYCHLVGGISRRGDFVSPCVGSDGNNRGTRVLKYEGWSICSTSDAFAISVKANAFSPMWSLLKIIFDNRKSFFRNISDECLKEIFFHVNILAYIITMDPKLAKKKYLINAVSSCRQFFSCPVH